MNEAVWQAFGRSQFIEEHKGNFARAKEIAAQNLTTAKRSRDNAQLADAWLDRGIVHLLQGELNDADKCIDQARKFGGTDVSRSFKTLSYKILVTYERYNTWPDGAGAGATEISARWQGTQDLIPLDREWNALLQQVSDSLSQIEGWLAYGFLCNLKPARYILESARYTPSTLPRDQLAEQMVGSSWQLRRMGEAGKVPSFMGFADLSAADLFRRSGNLKRARDLAGLATCQMILADWADAPFSTPLAWNFEIRDSSTEAANLFIPLEADEFAAPNARALDNAESTYAGAEHLFKQANAPRGLAAIQLRRGYLAMLNGDYAAALRFASTGAQWLQ